MRKHGDMGGTAVGSVQTTGVAFVKKRKKDRQRQRKKTVKERTRRIQGRKDSRRRQTTDGRVPLRAEPALLPSILQGHTHAA